MSNRYTTETSKGKTSKNVKNREGELHIHNPSKSAQKEFHKELKRSGYKVV